jgi:Vps5 C terminal like
VLIAPRTVSPELANALIEFGSSFSVLGESEADAVGSALSKFGAVSARLAASTNIQAEQERILFEEPVKEYLGVLAAAKVSSD